MKKERKEKESKKEKNANDWDDGRVIADMDIDGFPWHGRSKRKKRAHSDDMPTFKEKWAIIFGAYRAYFPILLVLCGTLLVMFFLSYLWLGR